jgi:hypothetical protein
MTEGVDSDFERKDWSHRWIEGSLGLNRVGALGNSTNAAIGNNRGAFVGMLRKTFGGQ